MITLDIKEFKDNIKSLEDVSVRKHTGGIQYLYDTIYSAIINGKYIHVGDIDFSRFSASEYEVFYNKMMEIENNARALYSVFGECYRAMYLRAKYFFKEQKNG